MLDLLEVDPIADKAASAALKGVGVSRVYSEPALDSDGNEALHVTIVLKGNEDEKISGDFALDTIVGIERALSASGEERFPIVEFVTEDELRSDDDTES